jgi:hypothetical protein
MGTRLHRLLSDAILGIDTLWGGDVLSPSGAGRFIADSWFSDEPLPPAYTHPAAAPVRVSGGVSAASPDRAAIAAYLAAIDVHGAIQGVAAEANTDYLRGLAGSFEVMWDLVLEILGQGDPVPYARAVRASTGDDPSPSDAKPKREQLAALLDRRGFATADDWRRTLPTPMDQVEAYGAQVIAEYDRLTVRNLLPHLPAELHRVPRANIRFLTIADAWFSGSMNYLGRARRADGSPEYEATYEINSALEISRPEFAQLVSHEVVPGHVTTFAYLQNLYARKLVGFEASVLTMNTRAATLFEGIANNAILMAHGVTEVEQLPDEDLQIGVLLALLQDDAKNQSSYLTWKEGVPQAEVADVLRRDFLVSEERAGKLSGAWGRHPLLGRMYLPAYRAGTERVAALRRRHAPDAIIPALYGCRGLVDVTTIGAMLEAPA